MAMNKEFLDLLESALADDVIEQFEFDALMKKADQLGIDRDEARVYIQSEYQKRQQAAKLAQMKQLSKVCAGCGKQVQDLYNVCPHCGTPVTPELSAELDEILDKLEDYLVDIKTGRNSAASKAKIERYVRKAKTQFGNNPKVIELLAEIDQESVNAAENAEIKEITAKLEDALVTFKGVAQKREDKAIKDSNMIKPLGTDMVVGMINSLTGRESEASKDTTNQDYATKKAEVERYIRMAKMSYPNNAKISFLVSEVEQAIADSEKAVKKAKNRKKKIIISIIIVWILLMILSIGIPLCMDGLDNSDSNYSGNDYSESEYDDNDSDDEWSEYDEEEYDEYDSEDDWNESDDEWSEYDEEEYDNLEEAIEDEYDKIEKDLEKAYDKIEKNLEKEYDDLEDELDSWDDDWE